MYKSSKAKLPAAVFHTPAQVHESNSGKERVDTSFFCPSIVQYSNVIARITFGRLYIPDFKLLPRKYRIHIYIYIYMCVCVCVYIYIYIYASLFIRALHVIHESEQTFTVQSERKRILTVRFSFYMLEEKGKHFIVIKIRKQEK